MWDLFDYGKKKKTGICVMEMKVTGGLWEQTKKQKMTWVLKEFISKDLQVFFWCD